MITLLIFKKLRARTMAGNVPVLLATKENMLVKLFIHNGSHKRSNKPA